MTAFGLPRWSDNMNLLSSWNVNGKDALPFILQASMLDPSALLDLTCRVNWSISVINCIWVYRCKHNVRTCASRTNIQKSHWRSVGWPRTSNMLSTPHAVYICCSDRSHAVWTALAPSQTLLQAASICLVIIEECEVFSSMMCVIFCISNFKGFHACN